MSIELCNVGEQLAKLKKNYEDESANLEKLRAAADALNGLVWANVPHDWNFTVSAKGWGSLHVDVHLAKDQAIGPTAAPLLRALAATRRYKPATFSQHDAHGFVQWYFSAKEDSHNVNVYVWLGSSQVCRKVPTGRMIPEMKIECGHLPPTKEEDDGQPREATG